MTLIRLSRLCLRGPAAPAFGEIHTHKHTTTGGLYFWALLCNLRVIEVPSESWSGDIPTPAETKA